MSIDPSRVTHVETPAATDFLRLLAAGAEREALAVLDEHWIEIWYAVDPTDLKTLLLSVPAEAFGPLRNARYLNALVGSEVATTAPAAADVVGPTQQLHTVAQEVADLRLAGRPEAAMTLAATVADSVRQLRGRLVDTSEGRIGVWLVQAGITAFLAGDLTTARSSLREVLGIHRPVRFPFVERDAVAKLALLHAVIGAPHEAAVWIARAEQMPRTASWVESMVDDSIRLATYICAVDSLDLERAELMRQEHPSPFAQLEFWGLALQAQVRHLCVTGRRAQARELCDEMTAAGLPLPGSDGWLATMVNDARLLCLSVGERPEVDRPHSKGEALLAHRQHLLATGQYRQLSTRERTDQLPETTSARTRLGLELLRGQGLLHAGRVDDGRRVVLDALDDAFERGTLGVLRFLTAQTLDRIDDCETGARARRLVEEHRIALGEVVAVLDSPLTPAETRVLRMLAEGLSRQQIADASFVSLDTVKSQLASVYRKLRVRSRADAVAKLEQLGG